MTGVSERVAVQYSVHTLSKIAVLSKALLLLCLGAGQAAPLEEVSIPVNSLAIIDQMTYPESLNACGPTALANSLRFGPSAFQQRWQSLVGRDDSTRLRTLIDRHFKNPVSLELPNSRRWTTNGVLCPDLHAAYQEIVERPITGLYADRRSGEIDDDLTARIHRYLRNSIVAGVPPILSLRTYIARRDPDDPGPVRWEPGPHHYVVATAVPKRLRSEQDAGFLIELIDPNGARQGTAFVYPEKGEVFRALKGETLPWTWLDHRPYLLVNAPGVHTLQPNPDTITFADRVVVTLNFVIGDFAP